MNRSLFNGFMLVFCMAGLTCAAPSHGGITLLNLKGTGYHGAWCYNQPQKDEFAYKYSGGLGTYCSSHNPFAVYCKEVNKTFFCYGGAREDGKSVLHMVSYYDHKTCMVPRPTILLDKRTTDTHDNPIISVDNKGYIWIFSSAHGESRMACISVSKKPYDINGFKLAWKGNYSYPQVYWMPGQGFMFLQTHYFTNVAVSGSAPLRRFRRLYFSTSPNGYEWTEPKLYGAVEEGHYQVSWSDGKKVGSAFNFHPSFEGTKYDGSDPKPKGLNYRSNLYYIETTDFGGTWRDVQGELLRLPLQSVNNPALVHDYRSEGLNVYLMDVNFDAERRPVILYLTSKGWEAGPKNGPRVWHTAWWNGSKWCIYGSICSTNNYDMGSLWVEGDQWKIIGPTEPGPQAYNTGGEIAMWISRDHGATWEKVKQLTRGSEYNHGYCRRPVNAHPDFYSLWADGHGRQKSDSRLYFTDRDGTHVWRLPTVMQGETAKPEIAW